MASFLGSFSATRSEEIGICAKDGRLCSLPIQEVDISRVYSSTNQLQSYPEINIARELFHHSSAHLIRDDKRSVLIPVQESLMKRVTRTFFEENLASALNEVQTAENVVVKTIAKYVLCLVNVGNTVKYFLRPHLRESVDVAKYSQTRDWARSPIRFIKWHPNTFKVAVATSDDIRVYTDETSIIPILKYGLQKGITCLAWRPFSAGELAVGCQNGVLIWTLHPNSHITRPLSQAHHLKCGNHFPVTSVDWSPNGSLLVTASINDSDLIIWDIDSNRNTPLKRVGHPCSLVKWSPDGSRLFSATVGNIFRVWTTTTWQPERWTVGVGAIQSAVWSPCGAHLLFITTEDQLLYSMKFVEEQLFNASAISKQALPIADLRKVDESDVGGRPQSLAWDPTGQYLAISYKDSPSITIFQTVISKFNLSISPSCVLNGMPSEHPSHICFQENFGRSTRSAKVVLTIGWSSGRIQYFPFL